LGCTYINTASLQTLSKELTWPPLKPTATTPISWRLGKNLGCIVGAADIVL